MNFRFFPLLFCLASTCTLQAAPETWPGWRGPSRDGRVAADSPAWPANLDAVKEVWRIEMSESYASPVVTADRVFTIETQEQKREVVRALDRKTGIQKWEQSWEGAIKVPFFARKNGSWVRSSPAYADGTLYLGGIRDVLVALDAATGDERWRADFVEREGSQPPGFGFVSSPLIDGEHLFVQAGSQLLKLDRSDGSKLWGSLKDDRAMYGSAFSSPVIAEMAGRRQLVVQTREELAGVSLDSGEPLWRYKVKAFRGMNILTPTVSGDQLFTSTYGGGSFLFSIAADGDQISASKTWFDKTEGYMSSPLLHEGHIFMHGRDKRFHCFELESGERKWSSEEKFGEYASLVARADRALALTDRGELLLIDLDPEKFALRSRRKISDAPTWAHLVVCGRELYVRELKAMVKFAW